MGKFLADESVDFRIVKALREDYYEVEAIVEINPSIDDEQVLTIANQLNAILITEDKDFGELTYRLRKPNKGIILLRFRKEGIELKIKKVKEVLEEFREEIQNRFTVITTNKVRIKDFDWSDLFTRIITHSEKLENE